MIKTGNSGSILSAMFRTILFELGINPNKFDILMEQYISRNTLTISNKKAANLRGYVKKELFQETMSWKTFINGLTLLRIKSFKITLTLTHEVNKITVHEQEIKLD